MRFNSVNLKYLEYCLAYRKDSIKICCFNCYFLDSQRIFKTIVRIEFFKSHYDSLCIDAFFRLCFTCGKERGFSSSHSETSSDKGNSTDDHTGKCRRPDDLACLAAFSQVHLMKESTIMGRTFHAL